MLSRLSFAVKRPFFCQPAALISSVSFPVSSRNASTRLSSFTIGGRDVLSTKPCKVFPLDKLHEITSADFAAARGVSITRDINPDDVEFTQETMDIASSALLKHLRSHEATSLKRFFFVVDGVVDLDENPPIPSSVWSAIGQLPALEELGLSIAEPDRDTWPQLTASKLPNLRNLYLDLDAAHGWNCSHLQPVLNRMLDLEQLRLYVPVCCGPTGLTLNLPYLKLKSFGAASDMFHSPTQLISPDFLQKNPQLEHLELNINYPLNLEPTDLPNLTALLVQWHETASNNPNLFAIPAASRLRRPIKHLRLNSIYGNTLRRALEATGSTLECLEMRESGGFRDCLDLFSEISQFVPHLKELGIITSTDNISPQPPPVDYKDLTSILSRISNLPELIALRFNDPLKTGLNLPQDILENLASAATLPPKLKYIAWQANAEEKMYELVRDGPGMVRMVETVVTREVKWANWTSESILRHV